MPTIDISQVKRGDLIFNYLGEWGKTPPSGHVAICTWGDQKKLAHIVHQVRGSMMNPISGTWRSDLRPTGAHNDAGIRVLRCKKPILAKKAAELAAKWDNLYQLPFGEDRVNFATNHEGQLLDNKKDIVMTHRRLFRPVGKYRAIKYAARRRGWLCYPEEEGNRSMFCSMFVVICYQVAGLDLGVAVESADPGEFQLRVSDKKMETSDFKMLKNEFVGKAAEKKTDLKRYRGYCDLLNAKDPYRMKKFALPLRPGIKHEGVKYLPSLTFWNYEKYFSIEGFDWQGCVTTGMMVDAKVIMPTGLYRSLLADDVGWEDKGRLIGEQAFSESKEERAEREKEKQVSMAQARKEFIARSKLK
jgi:hypothetical protein